MGFCDRERVRETIEGKRIALVGSGPGVLKNAVGFVDGHDVVIRINNYKLSPAAGFRTDVFYSFFGMSIRKRADELAADGVKLCMAKCPDAKFIESEWHARHGKIRGVDFRQIYREREDWWFCDTFIPSADEFREHFDLLEQHIPTTGFSALLDVLRYNPASVYMTGFDFFQSEIHNVNEKWHRINTSDPIKHVPDAERKWLADNIGSLPVTCDDVLTLALQNRVVPRGHRLVTPIRRRRA